MPYPQLNNILYCIWLRNWKATCCTAGKLERVTLEFVKICTILFTFSYRLMLYREKVMWLVNNWSWFLCGSIFFDVLWFQENSFLEWCLSFVSEVFYSPKHVDRFWSNLICGTYCNHILVAFLFHFFENSKFECNCHKIDTTISSKSA